MKTVYEAIKNSHAFQSLLSINLTSNAITIFPVELANLPSLQKIILSCNVLGANIRGQWKTTFFLIDHFLALLLENALYNYPFGLLFETVTTP